MSANFRLEHQLHLLFQTLFAFSGCRFKNFCKTNGLQFTRYADDLTFSSDTLIANDIVLDIINLIKKNGFEINEKKLRLKSSHRKQTVTGLTVNESEC